MPVPRHPWEVSPSEARSIQEDLRAEVLTRDDLGRVDTVAGTDVGFEAGGAVARAAVTVLSYPGLEPLEQTVVRFPTPFPYVPGLLSFREAPAVLEALERLSQAPDLLLCDGQGIAHPRRFGLACHLGVLTGIPSIGVAKSLYVGRHGTLPDKRGAWVPLVDRGEVVGAALRSRAAIKPIYVSSGHRISLETAIHYVMGCVTRFKLPETTRHAHRLASAPPLSGDR